MQADPAISRMHRLAAHLALRLEADLVLRLWDGSVAPLGQAASGRLAIALRSPRLLTRMLRRPRLTTLIEGFASGEIGLEGGTLLDLAERVPARRKDLVRSLDRGLMVRTLLPFLWSSSGRSGDHGFRGQGDQAEAGKGRDDQALVRFHYDLSNAFYALFLDRELVYSCGYWPTPETTLDQAQYAKLEHVCRKLRLRPGDRLLDIGCGWGALVCHAAIHHGVEAVGVTLSAEQHEHATRKITALGLEGRVQVKLQDFRALDVPAFDKVSSVGMYEHVGLDNRDSYFRAVRDRLKPRGAYLHHAIARPMKRNERAFRRKRPEFAALTRYIFPGGELDHIGGSLDAMERQGFEIHDVEGLREHYGRTCRAWTERLYAARETAASEVGHAKTELWLLYLAGCALAFERGTVGIFQTVATRKARGASGLPATRADLYRREEGALPPSPPPRA